MNEQTLIFKIKLLIGLALSNRAAATTEKPYSYMQGYCEGRYGAYIVAARVLGQSLNHTRRLARLNLL